MSSHHTPFFYMNDTHNHNSVGQPKTKRDLIQRRGETCALESISFAFHTLSIISLHVQSLTLVKYCLPA